MKKWKDNWSSDSPLFMPISNTLQVCLPLVSPDAQMPKPEGVNSSLTLLSSPQHLLGVKYNLRKYLLQLSPLPIFYVQVLQVSSSSSLAQAMIIVSILSLVSTPSFFLLQSCLSRKHIFCHPLRIISRAWRIKSKFLCVAPKLFCFLIPTYLCNQIFFDFFFLINNQKHPGVMSDG